MNPALSLVFRVLLLLLCVAPRFASAGESDATPLRKGDALLVHVENMGGGLPEYREIIDSDGNIEIPFLGFLSAADKLPSVVEAEMASAYANAKLAVHATVHLTVVTHFEPPPERANLVRVQDPRRPVSATNLPAATP